MDWIVWLHQLTYPRRRRGKRQLQTHLAQTHLVREDTVNALLVQVAQPGKTLELILFELRHEDFGLRDGDRVGTKRWFLEVEFVPVD
jgi:hypothetical protein